MIAERRFWREAALCLAWSRACASGAAQSHNVAMRVAAASAAHALSPDRTAKSRRHAGRSDRRNSASSVLIIRSMR